MPDMVAMRVMMLAAAAMTAACAPQAAEPEGQDNQQVSLRGLVSDNSPTTRESYPIQGELMPTPSDKAARYYLIRNRKLALSGNHVAIIRKEREGHVAYARVELNCPQRTFHVLGVGDRRSFAETDIAHDGPLRSIEGLPLRQELAGYICDKAGEALAQKVNG